MVSVKVLLFCTSERRYSPKTCLRKRFIWERVVLERDCLCQCRKTTTSNWTGRRVYTGFLRGGVLPGRFSALELVVLVNQWQNSYSFSQTVLLSPDLFTLLTQFSKIRRISFSGSGSRAKVCLLASGFRVGVYFFCSGFRAQVFLSLVRVSYPGSLSFTDSGFRIMVLDFMLRD